MLRRILPDRLSHWLVALVIGGILATQALALSLYHADRMQALEAAQSHQAAECVAGFAQLLRAESPEHRRMLMRPLMFAHRMEDRPPAAPGADGNPPPGGEHGGPPPGGPPPNGPPPDDLPPDGPPPPDGAHPPDGMHPPPNFLIHLPEMGEHGPPYFGGPRFFEHIRAESILPDGTKLTLDAPQPLSRFLTPTFAAYIAAVVAVGMLGSIWSVSLATKPLSRLSEAADRFGTDVHAPPVAETGPREVKHAAAAFNRMQRRLRQFVTDRTRMLAAISHDLRTPLTRMRLRAEMMEAGEQRAKILNDLQEMEDMVGATLAFARDENVDEPSQPIDLAALLETITADAKDMDQPVYLITAGTLPVVMRPRTFKRAVVNIIDNAVRYGGAAELSLRRDTDEAVLRIVDYGPGIPVSERENVLRPFYRIDGSRSRDTGGIGLGLSIASDTISAHGGKMALSETPGGGLTVEIRLPVAV
ncbi:MAG TPA: ATP-binding protein [Alphaproteobacteria bacterium]|jgi:signal transduction histidine kinase|nr:ATP-binding protein [Alphaproteobacteria bacterium]